MDDQGEKLAKVMSTIDHIEQANGLTNARIPPAHAKPFAVRPGPVHPASKPTQKAMQVSKNLAVKHGPPGRRNDLSQYGYVQWAAPYTAPPPGSVLVTDASANVLPFYWTGNQWVNTTTGLPDESFKQIAGWMSIGDPSGPMAGGVYGGDIEAGGDHAWWIPGQQQVMAPSPYYQSQYPQQLQQQQGYYQGPQYDPNSQQYYGNDSWGQYYGY